MANCDGFNINRCVASACSLHLTPVSEGDLMADPANCIDTYIRPSDISNCKWVTLVRFHNNMIIQFRCTAVLYIRTCWIYNLCGSIRIYKNQIHGIDPYADL